MQKLLFVTALALSAAQAQAAGLTVGAGSSIHFGNSSTNLGCGDLSVAGNANTNTAALTDVANVAITASGSLTAASSNIAIGGDFANAGTFAPGTGSISIGDTCGNGISHITGSSAFYNLFVDSSVGKQLVFPAGVAQSVAHMLWLQGLSGIPLQVLSSTPGTKARLSVASTATQTISWVNARDNDASGGATIAPGLASNYHSIDGGNLLNWFGSAIGTNGGAVPAPALGRGAALLLAALLVAFALKRRRTS